MADFDLAMAVTADGGDAVATAGQVEASIDKLDAAQRRAAGGGKELEDATGRVVNVTANLVGVESKLEALLAAVQQNTIGAARGHSALRDAIREQATATSAATQTTIGLGTAHEATAADANAEAVAERNLAAATSEAERAAAAAALAEIKLGQARDTSSAEARKAAKAEDDLEKAVRRATDRINPANQALRQYEQELKDAKLALDAGRISAESFADEQARIVGAVGSLYGPQRKATEAADDNAKALNRQAFGARNLGQQVGDLGLSIAGGISPARAFGQQAGQIGYALSEMGGRAGQVGAFLTGGWGIALTIGAAVLAPFIERMLDSSSAAETMEKNLAAAASAADSFGNAQSRIGEVIDLTTGKLKTQNTVLIESIRLQAYAGISAARKAEKDARENLSGIGVRATAGPFSATGNTAAVAGALASGLIPGVRVEGSAGLQNIANRYRDGTADIKTARAEIERLGAAGQLAGQKVEDVVLSFIKLGTARNDIDANQAIVDAIDGKGIDPRLKPYERPKKPKKPKSTVARDEFGRDAEDRIAGIVGQFDEAPAVLDKTNAKVRQLDDLIDDLARKQPPNFKALIASAEAAKTTVREGLIREVGAAFEKPRTEAEKAAVAIRSLDAVIADLQDKRPPNFEKLIVDAETAKGVIRDGLARPYVEFVKSQEESLAVQRLINAGQIDQAAALKIVQGLERTMGPLAVARKDAVLATVQALRAEQRETEILQQKQEKYLTAIGEIKSAVRGAIFDGLDGIEDLPKRLISAFGNLKKEELFEKLFGDVFRELEDQAKGTTTVRDASERMADAITTTVNPLERLAGAADKAAGALDGSTVGGQVAGTTGLAAAALPGTAGAVLGAIGSAVDKLGKGGADSTSGTGDDIVVTARRRERKQETAQDLFSKSIAKIAKGVGISDEAATKIGRIGGKAIAGAATGAAVNSVLAPIGKALGVKTSQTGAQIGGAIGSFLPIPFGSEIGAVVGSITGGLFKKAKTGSATIGNVAGEIGVTAASGNKGDRINAAVTTAGAVGDALNSIVGQLGGVLGNFAVSIGTRDKKFTVDPTGQGRTKGSGVQKFATEAEAQSAALLNAIVDGAVAGISDAMQRALRSSTDVDKAVQEALKVQEVELLIGGVGAQLEKVFNDQATNAAERLRIARKYGLDVIAVEKANAAERTKLLDDALKSSVGSLQDILTDLSSGDLFEGSAADRREAILGQIGTTRERVAAGEEGAADELAQLYRNLLATSRDAFGTAGTEYASDRTTVQSGAAAVIKAEQDRINKAAGIQQTAADAATRTADLTSETNDLLAVLNTRIEGLPAELAKYIASNGNAGIGNFYTQRAALP